MGNLLPDGAVQLEARPFQRSHYVHAAFAAAMPDGVASD